MSPHDVYIVLALLLKGQDSGVRLLEFSTGVNFDADAEQEINELPESDPPISSPRDLGIDSATAGLSDSRIHLPPPRSPSRRTAGETRKGIYNDGIGPPLLDSPILLLSAPATSVASPTIDPLPPTSPSLSDFMPNENVASDATAIDPPNQVLQPLKTASHKSGKETSNSNSKKRRREEQGGPNQDKKMKQAVPAREQSSRYDGLEVLSALY